MKTYQEHPSTKMSDADYKSLQKNVENFQGYGNAPDYIATLSRLMAPKKPTPEQLDSFAKSLERGKSLHTHIVTGPQVDNRPEWAKIVTTRQNAPEPYAIDDNRPEYAKILTRNESNWQEALVLNHFKPDIAYQQASIPVYGFRWLNSNRFHLSKPRTTPIQWFAYLSAAIAITACLAYVYQLVNSVI